MVHRSALNASRIRAETIQTRKVFDIFKGRIVALVESRCYLEHSLANCEIAGRKNLFQNRDLRRLVIYRMGLRKRKSQPMEQAPGTRRLKRIQIGGKVASP